jgi:hypothetical protein
MFYKKIREELREIKQKIEGIESHLTQTQEEDGITICTLYDGHSATETVVRFSLPYCDWDELEKSKEWKQFRKLIWKYQRRRRERGK